MIELARACNANDTTYSIGLEEAVRRLLLNVCCANERFV